MLLFTLFSTGVVIGILRKFKINYLFIFELDPHYKITQIQLFRVRNFALMLLDFFDASHDFRILLYGLSIHYKD